MNVLLYNPEKMVEPDTQREVLEMFAKVGDFLDVPLCDASKILHESVQNEEKDIKTKKKCIEVMRLIYKWKSEILSLSNKLSSDPHNRI
jgi:hypothetical protein